ncbi:MAG: hydroxysqualene dehydroxylase HpnE [Proteobacteria bacterium]|nr:hydroxysqualene dehydroxylase HpnE [Pseudomonadota bacterium]MBU6425590.1 hydroxysqualene dehydroxylase HpnE [Rhodospirillales bacterium]
MSVHVIGAGLAGLSAACRLVELGHEVVLFEATPNAGGRARSYFDKQLGCRIDNGNHLLLSGNLSALNYLDRIGARETLTGPAAPIFPFRDVSTGEAWTLRLNQGHFPWWVFKPSHRVPGTRFWNYLALKKLLKARPGDLVEPLAGGGALYAKLLEPLAIAALNTMPDIAAAQPLGAVLAETVERGGFAALPRWARIGLSESFVDPALNWLRQRGVEIRFGERVGELRPGQTTILAVPPWAAKELMPELTVPDEFESICNLHFKAQMPPGEAGFYGLLGGMAEWVFPREEIISVTISSANRYAHLGQEAIAGQVWAELSKTFGLPQAQPQCRVLWEKRATFACTPAQLARRPGPRSQRPGVVLAGDWTDTGLPATIEGAIRSGEAAVAALPQPA